MTTRGTGRPARLGGGTPNRTTLATVLGTATVLVVAAAAGPGSGPAAAGVLRCQGESATVVGTAAADDLRGTAGPDVIVGRGGRDRIAAGPGADLVCAGARADRISGGAGADRLYGQGDDAPEGDTLGAGDWLHAGRGDDMIVGGDVGSDARDGQDVVAFGTGPGGVTVVFPEGTASGEGDDVLSGIEGVVGTPGRDVVIRRPYADREDVFDYGQIRTGAGDDRVLADAYVRAGTGSDTVRLRFDGEAYGGRGNDRLSAPGSTRHDLPAFYAGSGDDRMVGGDGPEYFRPGAGHDVARGAGGRDQFRPGPGDDVALGGAGADRITLRGWRSARGEADRSQGGPGTDIVDVVSFGRDLLVDLRRQRVSGPGTDLLRGLETVQGGFEDDQLVGDGRANLLLGDYGDDQLYGLRASDRLRGGPGDDLADGGPGRDRCAAETNRRC